MFKFIITVLWKLQQHNSSVRADRHTQDSVRRVFCEMATERIPSFCSLWQFISHRWGCSLPTLKWAFRVQQVVWNQNRHGKKPVLLWHLLHTVYVEEISSSLHFWRQGKPTAVSVHLHTFCKSLQKHPILHHAGKVGIPVLVGPSWPFSMKGFQKFKSHGWVVFKNMRQHFVTF